MKKETWKDIPKYEGLYQASNYGRVKSLERCVNTYNGKNFCQKHIGEKILKSSKTGNGYHKVTLYKNGKPKTFLVHLLVMRTFVGESILQIDHLDCNKTNNKIDNLEYVTPKENSKRAREKDLVSRIENKVDQYDLEDNFIKTWFNCADIERELKLCHSNIIKCCKEKRKKCGNYKWKYHIEQ